LGSTEKQSFDESIILWHVPICCLLI
jgi:hypothetical protein